MTGRAPTPCTDPLADYITRMQKVRHPFDKGLNARLGVGVLRGRPGRIYRYPCICS